MNLAQNPTEKKKSTVLYIGVVCYVSTLFQSKNIMIFMDWIP